MILDLINFFKWWLKGSLVNNLLDFNFEVLKRFFNFLLCFMIVEVNLFKFIMYVLVRVVKFMIILGFKF